MKRIWQKSELGADATIKEYTEEDYINGEIRTLNAVGHREFNSCPREVEE